MTTNIQLENYIKDHKLSNQTFLGVYPSDKLPHINARNACMIINYSPSNSEGTHWVAMRNLNSKNSPAEYFDSYGLLEDQADPLLNLHTNFKEYIENNSNGNGVLENYFDLQSWKKGEDECGEWCLVFIYEGLPNINNPVWAKFMTEKNAVIRDRMVKEYIGIRE